MVERLAVVVSVEDTAHMSQSHVLLTPQPFLRLSKRNRRRKRLCVMTTALLRTEFQHAYDLDHAELSFLSALYYQQKNNHGHPVSFTQTHIKNMTGVGIYAQRRVRQSLSCRGLMTERRTMKLVEGKGHRTQLIYNIACDELDKLLADVETLKQQKDPATERQAIQTTQAADVTPSSLPPVRMHAEWRPDADALASYLAAYDIDTRFALYDVLPEFVEYWIGTDAAFRPVQWQAKFHAAVRHQWTGDMNRRRNQARVLHAADLKANAIAAVKTQQAARMMASTRITDTSWARNVKAQPTIEELTSRDWVGKYDFGLDEDWV